MGKNLLKLDVFLGCIPLNGVTVIQRLVSLHFKKLTLSKSYGQQENGFRSSRPEVLCKKAVLKNFSNSVLTLSDMGVRWDFCDVKDFMQIIRALFIEILKNN